MTPEKMAKEIKPIITIATVKNGKINWIAQQRLKGDLERLKRYAASLGEQVIKVKVTPIGKQDRTVKGEA